jgi:hypothetical protein
MAGLGALSLVVLKTATAWAADPAILTLKKGGPTVRTLRGTSGFVAACLPENVAPPAFTIGSTTGSTTLTKTEAGCPSGTCAAGEVGTCFAVSWGSAREIDVQWTATAVSAASSAKIAAPDEPRVATPADGSNKPAEPAPPSFEVLYDAKDLETYRRGRTLFFALTNADQAEKSKEQWNVPQNLFDRSKNVAVLFFFDDGKPMYPLPTVDEATEIYGIVSFKGDAGTLRVSSCDAAPVRIGGGAGTAGFEVKREAQTTPNLRAFHAKGCSADTGLKVTIVKSPTETAEIAVPTLALYRLTIGLGFIYDFTHQTSFRAGTVAGEATPVVVQDEQRVGLASVAFVALRIFPADMVNTRSFGQAVSPAVGISLTHPTDHLYLAAQIEPWPGIGFIVGWHFLRQPNLGGGLSVGDRVPANQEIPTDDRWTSAWRNVFGGVTLSTDVLAKLLAALHK